MRDRECLRDKGHHGIEMSNTRRTPKEARGPCVEDPEQRSDDDGCEMRRRRNGIIFCSVSQQQAYDHLVKPSASSELKEELTSCMDMNSARATGNATRAGKRSKTLKMIKRKMVGRTRMIRSVVF